MSKTKKIIIAITFIIITFFIVKSYSNKSIIIVDVVQELGSKIDIDKELIFKNPDDIEIIDYKYQNQLESIDEIKLPVGKFDFEVIYEENGTKKVKPIHVIIKDQTKPVIEVNDKLVQYIGEDKIKYNKYLKIVDYSEYEVKVDDSKVVYNRPGNYEVIVTVIDTHNNKEVKKIYVEVKELKFNVSEVEDYMQVKGIVVINKKNPIPKDYISEDADIAKAQIEILINDMHKENLNVTYNYSGHRTYSFQTEVYNSLVNAYGQDYADSYSARPGFSEHQSGLAFDLKNMQKEFIENDPEASWIKDNAHKYGFIVRYPKGKDAITGYKYEPWHLRYVGDLAADIYKSNLTLEEYLQVEGGDYRK